MKILYHSFQEILEGDNPWVRRLSQIRMGDGGVKRCYPLIAALVVLLAFCGIWFATGCLWYFSDAYLMLTYVTVGVSVWIVLLCSLSAPLAGMECRQLLEKDSLLQDVLTTQLPPEKALVGLHCRILLWTCLSLGIAYVLFWVGQIFVLEYWSRFTVAETPFPWTGLFLVAVVCLNLVSGFYLRASLVATIGWRRPFLIGGMLVYVLMVLSFAIRFQLYDIFMVRIRPDYSTITLYFQKPNFSSSLLLALVCETALLVFRLAFTYWLWKRAESRMRSFPG